MKIVIEWSIFACTRVLPFFQINTLASGLFKLVALADDEVWSRTKLGTGAMTLAINYETVQAID